jgi:hypothetical protein
MATLFQTQIERLLEKHGRLEEFNNAGGDEGFHMKLTQGSYMPLVIERHGNEISVSHYYTQNGDVMYDPDVTLDWPTWSPTSIQQTPFPRRERYRYNDQGVRTHEARTFLKEVSSFLAMWGRNIRDQRWAENGIMEVEKDE